MWIIASLLLVAVNSVESTKVYIPTDSQVWYQQAEIHALIHFNMATYFHDGDPGCDASNWNESSNAESFKPTRLNTSQWADVMVDLGAKGAILTAKHGCGFLLWPSNSKLPNGTRYPYQVPDNLNVLKQFQDAMEERGIGHGFYYSLKNNFFLNAYNHVAGAAHVPPLPGQINVSQSEFESVALHQVTELWTQFGNLSEIWFDGGYTSNMANDLTSVCSARARNTNDDFSLTRPYFNDSNTVTQKISTQRTGLQWTRNFPESRELDRNRIGTS